MSKTCFFISRIGNPDSQERRESDKLLDFVVRPTLRKLGYDLPVRADHISMPGTITMQVFEHLWADDLVIADLTGHNPNVFYELAVRHLSKRPFVHMINSRECLPFDLLHERAVMFDFDVAKVEEAKTALAAMISSAEGKACQTLLSTAIAFVAGEDRNVALDKVIVTDIVSRLQAIQSTIEASIPKVYGLPSPFIYPQNALIFNIVDFRLYCHKEGTWLPITAPLPQNELQAPISK